MRPNITLHNIYKHEPFLSEIIQHESWDDLSPETQGTLQTKFEINAKEYKDLYKTLQRFKDIEKLDDLFTGTMFNYLGYEYCANQICQVSPTDYDCAFKCDMGREEKLDVSGEYNIRRAFIAREGFTLVSIDYSQIELRVTANIAKDQNWIDAFLSGEDVHTRTAKILFQTDNPTKGQRKLAKVCNFAILYGGTYYNLAIQAGVSVEEAKVTYDGWVEAVPAVMFWIKRIHKQISKDGFVKTAFGRKRPLPGALSDDWKIKSKALRQGPNSVIQGTSADIIKISMIKVDSVIKTRKWDNQVKLLATIHDELMFEIKDDFLHVAIPVLKEAMIVKQAGWPVPLTVDVEVGKNWGATSDYVQPDRDTESEDVVVYTINKFMDKESAVHLAGVIAEYKGSVPLDLKYADGSVLRIRVSDPDAVIERLLKG